MKRWQWWSLSNLWDASNLTNLCSGLGEDLNTGRVLTEPSEKFSRFETKTLTKTWIVIMFSGNSKLSVLIAIELRTLWDFLSLSSRNCLFSRCILILFCLNSLIFCPINNINHTINLLLSLRQLKKQLIFQPTRHKFSLYGNSAYLFTSSVTTFSSATWENSHLGHRVTRRII